MYVSQMNTAAVMYISSHSCKYSCGAESSRNFDWNCLQK